MHHRCVSIPNQWVVDSLYAEIESNQEYNNIDCIRNLRVNMKGKSQNISMLHI